MPTYLCLYKSHVAIGRIDRQSVILYSFSGKNVDTTCNFYEMRYDRKALMFGLGLVVTVLLILHFKTRYV